MKIEVITGHIYADLDALSSMILIRKKYPNAVVAFPGHIGKNVKAFVNLYQDFLKIKKMKDINLDKVTKIIVVDTAKKNRIGLLEKLIDKKDVKIDIFDHHNESKNDINNFVSKERLVEVKNNYGSNTTNIIEMLLKEDKDLELNEIEATIGLMGLYEDTGNFTFSSTTPTDLKVGAYLLGKKANLSMVREYVQKGLEKEQLETFIEFMENEEILEVEGKKIMLTYHETDEYIMGLDEIINKVEYLRKPNISIILCGNKEKLTIVGRSSNKLNIAKILKEFNVEGHQFAVSGYIKGRGIKEVLEDIKKTVKKSIATEKKAKDIMKKPVKTISETTKVKTAYKIMYRIGSNGLPIVRDDKLVGIITRNSIDKALNHGFANAPVSAYMTSDVITGNKDMTIEELKAIIVENSIGRIPIVENQNEIKGIVTRKDILESIYNRNPIRKKERKKIEVKIKDKIQEKIPFQLLELLKEIEKVSKKRNEKAFLVGGIVRDLVLGIENKDIDIVIEGDSLEFAKDLKVSLNAKKVVLHEKFKTAVVVVNDKLKLDIAGSRLEYYEYPTSLPTVEYGNIRDDMYRRDFTVNAMALEVDSFNFGKLIDFYNGYEDLKNKKIRVLHNLSFIEDPTRIIRAFRFSARYNFDLEKDTKMFLNSAINDGFLKKVSWPRVKQEMKILFSDKNIMRAMEYMEEYKVFHEIHPNINYNKEIKENIAKIDLIEDILYEAKIERWLIVFLVILENLKAKELDLVFNKFNFSKRFMEKYDYGIIQRDLILKKLEKSTKKSQIYSILEDISLEVVVLLYIQNKDKDIGEKIREFIITLKNVKQLVTGKDLLELGYKPGIEFKNLLKEYFLKQLDLGTLTKKELLKS